MPNTATIAADTLDFSPSPLFCKNGDAQHKGQIIHTSSDATVTQAGQENVAVKPGGILFRSEKDGALSFYTDADFTAGFSRLLRNGFVLPLTETPTIQILRIKAAGDLGHAGDLGLRGIRDGVAGARNLVKTALRSDTGLLAQEKVDGLKQDVRDFRTEVREATNEVMGDVSQAVQAVSSSSAGQKARATLTKARRFWGAMTNKT